MQKMTWTVECRLNNEEIDSQHRLLFAIANELLEIENPLNQGPEIKYLLRHLREYVEKHFEDEENLLAELGYPGLEEHKHKHEKIVLEIRNSIKSSLDLITLKHKLEDLLHNWIKQHILIEDKMYADWAKYKGKFKAI